jgi:hypothetical protein
MAILEVEKRNKKHQIWFSNHIWCFLRIGLEFGIRKVDQPSSQKNGTMARQAWGRQKRGIIREGSTGEREIRKGREWETGVIRGEFL